MLEVTCDNCKKDFTVKPERQLLPNGIHRHYFCCPFCQAEYTFSYTDKDIRELQEKINKEWEKFHDSKSETEREALLKSIDKLKRQLGDKMAALRKKMKGGE